MPTEIASLLATADVELSPAERKLQHLEQRLDQVAQTSERTSARSARSVRGLEASITQLTGRIPYVGSALALVERQAFSLQRTFDGVTTTGVRGGQQLTGMMRNAQGEADKYAGRLRLVRAELEALKGARASVAATQAARVADFARGLNVKFGGDVDTAFLREFGQAASEAQKLDLIAKQFGLDLTKDGAVARDLFKGLEQSSVSFGKIERSGAAALSKVDQKIATTGQALKATERDAAAAARGLALVGQAEQSAAQGASLLATALPIVTTGLIAVVGAAVAADAVAVLSAQHWGEWAFKIGEMTEETGLSVRAQSALVAGARIHGAQITQVNQALLVYLRNLSEVAHGNEALGRTFLRFGIDSKKAAELMRDPDQALADILARLQSFPAGGERIDAAFKLAAKGGKVLLGLSEDMQGSFANWERRTEELGVSLDEVGARRAEEFERKWREAGLKVEAIFLRIGEAAAPGVEQALEKLTGQVGTDTEKWAALGTQLGAFVSGTADVLQSIHEISAALDRLNAIGGSVDLRGIIHNAANNEGTIFGRFLQGPDFRSSTGFGDHVGRVDVNNTPAQTPQQIAATAYAALMQQRAEATRAMLAATKSAVTKQGTPASDGTMGGVRDIIPRAHKTKAALQELLDFANEMHVRISRDATNPRAHVPGSAHAQGRAIDIPTAGLSAYKIEEIMQEAQARGYKVLDERQRPSTPGPSRDKWTGPHIHVQTGGRSGVSVDEQIARSALELERTLAESIKRIQGQRLADADYFYQTSLTTFEQYATKRRAAATAVYTAALAENAAEARAVQEGSLFGRAKEAALAQVEEKRKSIEAQYQADTAKIDRDAQAERIASERQAWDQLTALTNEKAQGLTQIYQTLAERGVISFRQAGDAIRQSQMIAMLRELTRLQTELANVNPDSQAGRDLLGQINVQGQRINNARAGNPYAAQGDSQRDTDTTRARAQALNSIYDGIRQQELDNAQARLNIWANFGTHRAALQRAELTLALARQQAEASIRLRDLKDARAYEDLLVELGYDRAANVKALDAQIAAEEKHAAQERASIAAEFLQQQRDRLHKFSDETATILSAGITGGLSGARAEFRNFLQQAEHDLLQSQLRKMFENIFDLSAGGTGKSGGLIGQIAKALGIAGLQGKDAPQITVTADNTQATRDNSTALRTLTARMGGVGGGAQPTGGRFSTEIFGLPVGNIFDRFLNPNNNGGNSTPGAIHNAGQVAVEAITGAGGATGKAIAAQGDATTQGLGNVSHTLLSGLAQIANQIAVGNSGGGFWKGLFSAAATGFISGLFGAKGGGGGKGDTGGGSGGTAGKAAMGDYFPARAGGHLIEVGEGGYDEVVLTTDPQYRPRMANLLASYLRRTGLKVLSTSAPKFFAAGGWTNEGPAYIPPPIAGTPTASSQRGGPIHITVRPQIIVRPDAQGRVRSAAQIAVEQGAQVQAAQRNT